MKNAYFCAMALLAAACAAHAQGLSDPTRPPGASALETETPAPSSPRLQSILISPQRKLAVINGEAVALGGRVGEATLIRISEASVVLKRNGELETLRMFPSGMDKKPAPASVARTREKGEKP